MWQIQRQEKTIHVPNQHACLDAVQRLCIRGLVTSLHLVNSRWPRER
jgi:hypothetical protein